MISFGKCLAIAAACGIVLTVNTPVRADSDVVSNIPAPKHDTHNCIETHIQDVASRIGALDAHGKFINEAGVGFVVTFAGKLPDPYIGALTPRVTHYQNDPADEVMAFERRGDPAIVCVIAFPEVGSCDPTHDARGRTLMVYDVKLRTSYYGWNSEHGCGGA